MRRGGACLGTAQKCRTELSCARTRRENRGNGGAGADPARCDDRDICRSGQELQENKQPVVLTVRTIEEATAMTAGLTALGDKHVSPGGNGGLSLLNIGHGHPDFGSGPVQ